MRDRELIIDSFAGGGGASLGIARALGRGPDVAINHDAAAIAMHAANHPEARHFEEDVWKVSPRTVTRGRPVGLLWASPDCKHFSRAKGSKPVEKSIRSLAWVVVKWAEQCSPRVVVLENVREFEEWGPLLPLWGCRDCQWTGTEGQATLVRTARKCPRCDSRALRMTERMVPDPARKGLTFKRFTGRLRNLGYRVEWRTLNAADYGAPTHRRRLFLVARNDGAPVVWPDPTHGDPKKIGRGLFDRDLRPWRTAAEIIDWSLPCPSIFTRKRPLAEATLRRIALGIKRYVLDNPKPFIVDMQRTNRARGTDEPMGTATTQDNRFNLVSPVVVPVTHQGERRTHGPAEPLPTVTGANRGELGLAAPVLVRGGQTNGNGKYANPPTEPLTTVTSKAEHMLVTPVLANLAHGGGRDGRDRGVRANSPASPLGTIHAGGGSFALIAPTLIQTGYGEREGQTPRTLALDAPMGTAVAGGCKQAVVAAFLAKHFGGVVGVPVDTPMPTATTIATQNQVVAANLVHLNHGEKTSSGCDEPGRTVTAAGTHAALVYSFLTKYFGTAVGQSADDPLHTVTGKDRFGLVTVEIDGEPFVIADIGMRMLTPRELARGQGFPDSYLLTGTKTSQVARIGNSVPPVMAEVLVAANYCPEGAGVPA